VTVGERRGGQGGWSAITTSRRLRGLGRDRRPDRRGDVRGGAAARARWWFHSSGNGIGDRHCGQQRVTAGLSTLPVDECGSPRGWIDVFSTIAPPIADRAAQQSLIDRLGGEHWSGFTITYAEPTHLGVVALVRGNYQAANSPCSLRASGR
jgi:hypothetical protein